MLHRMRYPPEHKLEARSKLLRAAGRGFRRKGFGGIGVDGLAKEADLTSGAFYTHFSSKDDAFRQVVVQGLNELRDAIAGLQASRGEAWIEAFIDLYLGEKRTCELGDSCALQSLTPEVARSDAQTQTAYEEALLAVSAQVAKGLNGTPGERRRRAWSLLSILAGSVSLGRAVGDGDISRHIATAVRGAALRAATE